MPNKKLLFVLAVIINIIIAVFISVNVWADEDPPAGDEQATISDSQPDVLIVLDLSGSMAYNPIGTTEDEDRIWGNSSCNGSFYTSSGVGHTTKCSRLDIAKRALFNILDDDNSGTIDAADYTSLGVRIGFMRFKDTDSRCQSGNDTAGNYSSGAIKLVDVISTLGATASGTSYQLTYCGNSTSCASTASSCTSGECIVGENACGGTPLASALKEAKTYMDVHKASDPYKACRQKFVILLTDGADTFACSGAGSECQNKMYARRREVIAAAKNLNDAGYKVFVVGFGSAMPAYLQNTLNWMAWYGGTDNPLLSNSGSKTAYNITVMTTDTAGNMTGRCDLSSSSSNCFPSGIVSGQTDTSTITNSDCGSSTSGFRATNNDPGYFNLSGYAFLAGDADALTAALKSAMDTIREATYSFTQASIEATRIKDENYLYEASFEKVSDPFWIGHLKRYSIKSDGSVNENSDWDAGEVLQAATSRHIYTLTPASSTLQNFEAGNLNITNTILGVTTDAKRTALMKFITEGELATGYTYKGWKLGDILHTSPLSIATPNENFYDQNDKTCYSLRYGTSDECDVCLPGDKCCFNAFQKFWCEHQRKSSLGNRIVFVGANDGQLHAFNTGNGSELWSFIPPNLLSRLSYITHSTHPTALSHTFFVDGPLSAADIWTGTGTIGSTYKSDGEWKTYLIMSEGRGGLSNLWSKNSSCGCPSTATNCSNSGTDPAFSPAYTSTYHYYCGYYAFDITATTTLPPSFKWILGGANTLTVAEGAHLGQPWSKMYIGRVRDGNDEKWVGFIGGGYSGTACVGADATCDKRGKGFYVIDLSNGNILKSFTHATYDAMDYNLAAGPIAVDSDGDGFLDTAYVGDLGGNMWRFKFCLKKDGTSCGSTSWTGSLLFSKPSTTLNIYTAASVTFDSLQNPWVYFGTGNKTTPLSTTNQDRIYAIKDSDRSTTYTLGNLNDITSSTYTDSSTGHGWYINFPSGTGEKILAAPVVYDKKVYFTTYKPSSYYCDQSGFAKLYIVDYKSGGGKIKSNPNNDNGRSEGIGEGTPSGAVISVNPDTGLYDVYVSTSAPRLPDSGSGGTPKKCIDGYGNSHTCREDDSSDKNTKAKNLIYWNDMRVRN